MDMQQVRDQLNNRPKEFHLTAAWANVEDLEPISQIPIPNEFDVLNAKEWVDSNQK